MELYDHGIFFTKSILAGWNYCMALSSSIGQTNTLEATCYKAQFEKYVKTFNNQIVPCNLREM